jgi:uncharacterized protein
MNVEVRPLAAAEGMTRLAIADCDTHPVLPQLSDLDRWLSQRWRDYIATYGMSQRQGHQGGVNPYPKAQPNAARRDAWPPGGGAPGTDLDFMRAQYFEPLGVRYAVINPLTPSGQGFANPDLSGAMCRATNEWQAHDLVAREGRFRASICVPYEDTAASVAEIERLAGRAEFCQVLILGRTAEPLGAKRYRPIFAAAAAAGLPVSVHAFGYGGGPVTSGGWPSYYIEEMTGHAQAAQSQVASMVVEGLFEELPGLKVVMVEAGFAWLPALAWRLDRNWRVLKRETPHLRMAPSEYIHRNIWLTTQPMEEPEPREHLLDVIGWIGWDRLLFATDYPHWDFDDPSQALPLKVDAADRERFFIGNAREVFGFA